MGLSGVGIDFGADAITATTELLSEEIHSGKFRTILADMASMPKLNQKFNLVISMMVVEHVEADSDFVRQLVDHVSVGGTLVIAVPGRKNKWTFEDEIVGHVRRYERHELEELLSGVGIQNAVVWSVGVPTVNMLARVGDRMVKRHADDVRPSMDARQQTEHSGLQQIPFKTSFPKIFRLLLNRWILWPLFFLQRRFYHSRFGIVLFGFGTVGSISQSD
jgi:SAM-dependent methyltransferase